MLQSHFHKPSFIAACPLSKSENIPLFWLHATKPWIKITFQVNSWVGETQPILKNCKTLFSLSEQMFFLNLLLSNYR